jgi:hypothetical protein
MEILKKNSYGRIIVYRFPILDRILYFSGMIFFDILFCYSFKVLTINLFRNWFVLVLLIGIIVIEVLLFFLLIRSYICFDFDNEKLYFSSTSGIYKTIDINSISRLEYEDYSWHYPSLVVICEPGWRAYTDNSFYDSKWFNIINNYERQKEKPICSINKEKSTQVSVAYFYFVILILF